MKYTRKTYEVEAQQFIPEQKPWPAKVAEGGGEGKNNLPRYHVPVKGGVQEVVSGDYVIDHLGWPTAEVIKEKDFLEKFEAHEKKEHKEEKHHAKKKEKAA